MSIPSWAVKGAKCVCIDDSHPSRPGKTPHLTQGQTYEVEFTYTDYGIYFIALVGVGPNASRLDNGWLPSRFRPLVSDKTEVEDVALFRHHLDQRVPEKA